MERKLYKEESKQSEGKGKSNGDGSQEERLPKESTIKTEDETANKKQQQNPKQTRNMESRKKKNKKLEGSTPSRTLLFHRLPVGVEAVGSVCSTSFPLQILTLNLLSPKSPTLSTAEFKQNPLTSEGLIREQIFLQDKFAETVKNGLVGPENQESLKWSHWERKKCGCYFKKLFSCLLVL